MSDNLSILRSCIIIWALIASHLPASSQTAEPLELLIECSLFDIEAIAPECKTLPFQVLGRNPEGRYTPLIEKSVAAAPHPSTGSDYEIHAHSIAIFNALNNCSIADAWFEDCINVLDASYESCKDLGRNTDWAYYVCGQAKASVLSTVLGAEIAIFEVIRSSDAFILLNESHRAWNEFVEIECYRKFAHHGGGSIAPLEKIRCYNSHYENRIAVINGENRFQGRDVSPYVDLSVSDILIGLAL